MHVLQRVLKVWQEFILEGGGHYVNLMLPEKTYQGERQKGKATPASPFLVSKKTERW